MGSKKMNILVTGGAGFIASHIVDAYIEMGHQVVIVDNLITGRKENVNKKATFIEMDIRDPEIERVIKEYKIDIINHHAAQMDVRKSVEDPIYDAEVNVLGALNILQLAVKYKIKKFIFASTGGAIYGEQDYFPADENHPLRPISPYGITKLTTEKYLYYYQHEFGLNYAILRYANVYGPRQNPHGEAGVVAIFTQRMLKGEEPVINGDGLQTRDFVYVGDVVRANRLALTDIQNEIYNIGTGKETDVNTIFRILRDNIDTNIPEKHGPAKPGEQRRSCLSYQKIKKDFGWDPTVSIEEGLKLTVDYFKNEV
jgi:UDP-glucose 4-epimerase